MEFPEISGYTITRRLGQGGMATVFLAQPTNFERNVALKVMSTQLHQDKQFTKRFMREARTMAQMSHQHIVQVFDIGEAGLYHYIAMEYLPGGDLKQKLRRGIELSDGIQIIKEVASALNYAATKNFIHRDIKPDNILFREDGSSVICDFGIARDTQATQLTSVGTIMGSPHYMSPEQAKGMELDGRSDLYSLGIIIYEMLTGSVPFDGDSAVSIGVKHVSEEPPLLPVDMQDFQPFINKALAKNTDERFQTGQKMIEALDDLMYELSDLGSETILMSMGDWSKASSRHKKRRSIRIDDIRTRSSSAHQSTPAIPKRLSPLLLKTLIFSALGVAAVGASFWWLNSDDTETPFYTEQSRGENRSSYLNNKAVQAIKEGRLLKPESDNALYYLTTVLTLWPEDKAAIKNIKNLFKTLLIDAEAKIAQGDFGQAKILLNQTSQITFYVDESALKKRQQKLNEKLFSEQQKNILLTEREVQIAALLEQAENYLAEDKITSPAGENAFDNYQKVLSLDPENSQAKKGFEILAGAFLAKAKIIIDSDSQLDRAKALISAAVQMYPEHDQIKALSNEVKQKQEQHNLVALKNTQRTQAIEQEKIQKQLEQEKLVAKISTLLKVADKNLQERALHEPLGKNAISNYKKVLQLDAENKKALTGLKAVSDVYITMAKRATSEKNLDLASQMLDRARKLAPQNKTLLIAQKQWRVVKDQQLQALQLAKAKQLKINLLLSDAEGAVKKGRIYKPTNNNALEKLDQVLKLDGNNKIAITRKAELLEVVSSDAVIKIQESKVADAQTAIDALIRFKASKKVVSTLQLQLEGLTENSVAAKQQQQAIEAKRLQQEKIAVQKRLEEQQKQKAARQRESQAQLARQRESNQMLQQADQMIAVKYKKPGLFGDNDETLQRLSDAYLQIQRASDVDKNNPTVNASLRKLGDKYSGILKQLMNDGELSDAKEFINNMPNDARINSVKNSLQNTLAELEKKKKSKRKISVGAF